MSNEILDQIYAEMNDQGEDKDVHLAIETLSAKTDIPEEELLNIYDRCY